MMAAAELVEPSPEERRRRAARLVLARLVSHPGFYSIRQAPHALTRNLFVREWQIGICLQKTIVWFYGPTLIDALEKVGWALDHPDHPDFL